MKKEIIMKYAEKTFLGIGIGMVFTLLWWFFVISSEELQVYDSQQIFLANLIFATIIICTVVVAITTSFSFATLVYFSLTISFVFIFDSNFSVLFFLINISFIVLYYVLYYVLFEVEIFKKEHYIINVLVGLCLAMGVFSGLILVDYKSYLNMAELEKIVFCENEENKISADISSPEEGEWITSHLFYSQLEKVEDGKEIISRLSVASDIIVSGTIGNKKYQLQIEKQPCPLIYFSYDKQKKVKVLNCPE